MLMLLHKHNQQSAMIKTDAGTCASLSVSLLTTSYLPGYLPGVATPGADIQWTSS